VFFDPWYFLFLAPGLAVSLWATFKVRSTFRRYSQVRPSSAYSGAQVAELLLSQNGLRLPVEEHPGELSDHYDPRERVLRLSSDVFHGRSLAAIGVAAHEVGHALQHASQYQPLMIRQQLAPAASFGSKASWFLLLLGFLLNSFNLVLLGILVFSLAVAFQLITLPVELNASRRAKALVSQYGIITESERGPVAQILNAAAMTYVAAALTALLTLLYYLIRSGLLGGSRD
jgi:hypothetical protein